jgi:hypothetical protein
MYLQLRKYLSRALYSLSISHFTLIEQRDVKQVFTSCPWFWCSIRFDVSEEHHTGPSMSVSPDFHNVVTMTLDHIAVTVTLDTIARGVA